MFKLKDNDVILFQGDSITDGNRGRNEDLNHIHGHGYQYILASEMYADNFGKNIEVINRGISGNRISELYGRWKEDCLLLKPTVLSILVGINDLHYAHKNNSGSTPERYEKIYRLLLDEALEQNPDMLIVLMEPFFGVKDDEDYNSFMQKNLPYYVDAVKRVAADYGAVFVPLQDVFDEAAQRTDISKLLWDGVHPTTGGHQLIARRWKECVLEKLNKR